MVVGYGAATVMILAWAVVAAEPKWLLALAMRHERHQADRAEEVGRQRYLATTGKASQ
jgi:hypothetical protein